MIENSELEKIISNLSRMKKNENNKFKLSRIKFCQEFIERIITDNISLKETCPFNYFYIGNLFETHLQGEYKEDFDIFYLYCVRFLKEYILHLERLKINPINPFITSLWDKFECDDLSLLDERAINQAQYIRNKMAVNILNFYFGEDGFKSFKEYEKFKKDIAETNKKFLENKEKIEAFLSEKEEEIETLLYEKEKSVKRLENTLHEQKNAFNFVGLSKGFENLLKKKTDAKCATFFLLGMIGLGLFTIPYLYIYFLFHTPESISNLEHWKVIPGFIGLELILLYFFRVVLLHYNSIQTQIMQLELRQSLCQFIQSYADYAKEIKEKNDISLEKFENIIFSNILSDGNKVPGTFDGIETLAKLIKEIRGGK